jgi:hypothetical protein
MEHFSETDYFKVHQELDKKHENMGKNLLQDLSERQYLRLSENNGKGEACIMRLVVEFFSYQLMTLNYYKKNNQHFI